MSGRKQSGSVLAIGAWVSGEEIPGQATEFNGFTVRSLRRAFGPVDGEIVHDPESNQIEVKRSGVRVADAVIEARFFNPYAVSEGSWSSGFFFRNSGLNELHAIVIDVSGIWYHRLSNGTVEAQSLQAKVSSVISTSPAGSNLLRLIALGDDAWFFVNGSYVDKLDLSGWDKKGGVSAISNFFSGDGLAGKSTSFQDFTVWSIGLND